MKNWGCHPFPLPVTYYSIPLPMIGLLSNFPTSRACKTSSHPREREDVWLRANQNRFDSSRSLPKQFALSIREPSGLKRTGDQTP